MLFVTLYRWRPDRLGKEDWRKILDINMKLGRSPGEIAHYVFPHGQGGVVVHDASAEGFDHDMMQRVMVNLAEYFDVAATQTYPAWTVERATEIAWPIIHES